MDDKKIKTIIISIASTILFAVYALFMTDSVFSIGNLLSAIFLMLVIFGLRGPLFSPNIPTVKERGENINNVLEKGAPRYVRVLKWGIIGVTVYVVLLFVWATQTERIHLPEFNLSRSLERILAIYASNDERTKDFLYYALLAPFVGTLFLSIPLILGSFQKKAISSYVRMVLWIFGLFMAICLPFYLVLFIGIGAE